MLNEKKLTKAELNKREEIIMKMKKNKRSLVDKYGRDAEAVMYGRATNMVKKQSESMKKERLSELIKDALTNPKAADLNKDGKISDYEETRGKAIEKNLKETRDDYAQMMASTLIDAIGTSSTLENLVAAMSTDDARLYLGAIMRDYDIDNPMDINLDNLEEVGGYDRKGNKEIEPKGDVKRRKVGIGNALNEFSNNTLVEEIIEKLKDADLDGETIQYILEKIGMDYQMYKQLNVKYDDDADDDDAMASIMMDAPDRFEEGKKLTKLKDIKETIKQMRSINEKSYPFDKCLDDNEGKYGKKGAAKICGSIRAAFGENIEESHSDAENKQLKKISKQLKKSVKSHDKQSKTIDKIVNEDDILEGLPKGYFKKKFGVGKKKKIKEASGPATIEDTEKAARKVVQAIKLEEPESKVEVSRGLEEGSFDIDINDRNYDGGSYTVDSDGDITLVSIRKPGFVGNLNDAASTIQSTMNDVLTNSPSKSGPAYSSENNE